MARLSYLSQSSLSFMFPVRLLSHVVTDLLMCPTGRKELQEIVLPSSGSSFHFSGTQARLACLVPWHKAWLLKDTFVTNVRINKNGHRFQSLLKGFQLVFVGSILLMIFPCWMLALWISSFSIKCRDNSFTICLTSIINIIWLIIN